jgi:peptidoglycan glycosyltransferase
VLVGVLLALVLVPLLIPAVGVAASGIYYTRVAAELRPRLDTLSTYQPFQTSRIFSRDGTLLYEYVTEGRRDAVPLDQVSPLLIDATVAIEDKNFWTNTGVDYLGIARSAYLNFSADDTVSGASTITQQFIKLVVLTQEEQKERIQRKIKEAVLAQQLTEAYPKEKILEMYLNEVNYGNRAYGIQAASRIYFGVDAKELNLNQASLLAGMPQQPTNYDLTKHMDGNQVLRGIQLKPGWLNPNKPLPNGTTPPRARQVDTLRQMVLNGMIREREAREAIAQDVQIVNRIDDENNRLKQQAPHFVDYVVEQLENDPELGPLLKNQGGLNITTTVDLRINQLVQEEVRRGIDELEARNVNNAAVVVQQPGTGQILAMVGSIDYNVTTPTDTPGEEGNVVDGQVNVATRERQPGSALKPFVYLAALQDGKATPDTIYWDVDTRFKVRQGATDANINSCIPEGQYWYCPKNYDNRWHGPVRMREALANSLNIPAILAIKDVSVERTVDWLHKAGITGLQRLSDYGYSLALGGGEVKLNDLTAAYNTLANEGNYIAPTPFLKITDRNGNVIRDAAPQPVPVFDPDKVALVRDYMDDDTARLPIFGRDNPLALERSAPVKTGTTNDFRDAWTMGFTPYVTVGVWAGNNNNESTDRIGGVGAGGLIWNNIMERLFETPELDNFLREGGKPLEFPELETYGLQEERVCQIGGSFGRRTTEWFTEEMAAEQGAGANCGLYKTVQAVQTANGGLCLPQRGVNYGGALTMVRVWDVPEPSDDMRIVGSSSGEAAAAPQNYCPRDVQLATPEPRPAAPQPSGGAPQPTPRPSGANRTAPPASQPTPAPSRQPAASQPTPAPSRRPAAPKPTPAPTAAPSAPAPSTPAQPSPAPSSSP